MANGVAQSTSGTPSRQPDKTNMKAPSEFDYFKAWLLFFLIATVIGGAIGMVTGSAVGAVLSARGMPIRGLALALQIVALVIAMPISYLTFRLVVGRYLLPKTRDEDHAPPVT
jgi:hypothetical protein